jgi:uncharacterized protein (TIGR03437 family)
VTFNGIPAPMFSSFSTQLNVQVPFELAGLSTASVVVTVAGQLSPPVTVSIGPASPGIFTVGFGQGAVLIANTDILVAQSGSISGRTSRPANPGEFITIFATGLGAVNNPPATGAPGTGNPTPTLPQVTIGGVQANVSFSGMAPGYVALYQVNAQVPQGVGGFVPVVMSIGGRQSNVTSISVSGNNSSGGNFCSGFALTGTATSLTGRIPGNCLSQLERGSNVTGAVSVSLTGAPSADGRQTIYSGTGSGTGTGQCATGSPGDWTANISMTITINTTVTSLETNGGVLNGGFSSSGSITFCGSTQVLSGIPASPTVTGSVLAGGATTVNIGGPMGLPPLVLRGTAQTLNGQMSGSTATSVLGSFSSSATGSVSIAATGVTSGNQTVYTGTGAGGGNTQCGASGGTWTANLSSFTATVSPTVASVATSGGTVSGTWSASLSGTVCGSNQSRSLSGPVSGTVSPGGSLTLTLAVGSDGGDNDNPVVLTGTATSLTATLTAAEVVGDPTATGSLPLSFTGVSSASQTVYTGGGTGGGTVTCDDGSRGNWTLSASITITLSPSVPSLAASGGNVSGTAAINSSYTFCGSSDSDQETDTVTGTVSPGGAVTLRIGG